MGCKCKETANIAKKYTNEDTMETLKGFKKILYFFKKVFIVLLVIIIFIIAVPFIILYSIISLFKGKRLNFNLTKLVSIFHVRN